MKKQKVSIKDIATKLNISKTTVSFILNGKAKEKRISDSLVEKVLRLVEEVGYQPNQMAQSLRTGKTKILGLMVEDISNPFFSSVAKHIETEAYQHGYKIIYCSTENDDQRAKDFLKMFHSLGIDGYILTPPHGIKEDIQWLVSQGENVVLFDRYFDEIAAEFVMVNNEESTFSGTKHLLDQGYRRIAFITLASEQPQMKGRASGYQKAMEQHGLSPVHLSLPFKREQQYVREIKDFLSAQPDLDAVFFGTNYLGVSGLEAVAGLKLIIPGDLAFMSFDDNDLFRINTPTITAIAQPMEKIAKTIVTALLAQIDAPGKTKSAAKTQGHYLPTELIIRNSTAKKAS